MHVPEYGGLHHQVTLIHILYLLKKLSLAIKCYLASIEVTITNRHTVTMHLQGKK